MITPSLLLLLLILAITIDIVTASDALVERASKTMKFLALATSMLAGAGELDDDEEVSTDPIRCGTKAGLMSLFAISSSGRVSHELVQTGLDDA